MMHSQRTFKRGRKEGEGGQNVLFSVEGKERNRPHMKCLKAQTRNCTVSVRYSPPPNSAARRLLNE